MLPTLVLLLAPKGITRLLFTRILRNVLRRKWRGNRRERITALAEDIQLFGSLTNLEYIFPSFLPSSETRNWTHVKERVQ